MRRFLWIFQEDPNATHIRERQRKITQTHRRKAIGRLNRERGDHEVEDCWQPTIGSWNKQGTDSALVPPAGTRPRQDLQQRIQPPDLGENVFLLF